MTETPLPRTFATMCAAFQHTVSVRCNAVLKSYAGQVDALGPVLARVE